MGTQMRPDGFIAIGFARFSRPLCAALVACVLAPTCVGAETAPTLARVAQIAADDPLNVRALPKVSSADIGDLNLGDMVEVLQRSADGKWSQILWQEGNAWISSAYLVDVARPRLDSGLPVHLSCGGNEPSWSVDLSKTGGFRLTSLHGLDADEQISWSTTSRNEGDSTHAFATPSFTGVLRREMCTDGASEANYGWRLDLIGPTDTPELLSGCCTLTK
jgi:uncharacterized membrane protein